MNLYHGGNVEVKTPKIFPNLRALDFGSGFYLTSSIIQASRWATIVAKRRRQGSAMLNVYKFNEQALSQLNVLRFETANEHWLDFVVANRKELPLTKQFDLVIGPVANDSTLPVIDDYMDGRYTKQEAVARLLPQNLTDQYAFLTEKALSFLTFERSETL